MMVTFREKIDRAKQFLKDILFPLFCIDCGQEGTILCDMCLKKIPVLGIFCCPVCKKPSETGGCCVGCESFSSLDSVIAVYPYKEHSVNAKLLHEFKYNGIEEARHVFKKIFGSFFDVSADLFVDIDFLVPIPLHPRRLAKRGFNQSEIFAELVSQELGFSVGDVLRRVHFTRPQVGLSFEERQKNVVSAFALKGDVYGKNIVLVDDVYTTGSTMEECAKILKNAGAKKVQGFTFARAVDEF